jgi:hypothetical protein
MPLAGKPISAYRYRTPPTPWQPRAITRPPLAQFVLLSMLLHALAISLFGAPSGGSREGRALWGSLQVLLVGNEPVAAPTLRLDPRLGVERPRKARTPRSERNVAPPRPEKRIEPVAPIPEPPRAAPTPVEEPFTMPPLLDRLMKPERKLELPPVLKVPPPTKEQSVRPPTIVPPAPSPPPVEAPVAEVPPAPRVERVPTEAPPVAAPLVAPAPLPLPERIATPPVERAPVETPVVPAIPITPPVERAPLEVPAIPVPSVESVTPPRSEAPPKAVEKAPVQEIPPPPAPPQRVQPQLQEAPPKIERETPVNVAPALRPSPAPGPSISAPRPREGEPSTTYDPTAAPSLDLDAMRKRAGSLAREGTGNRAALPFPMPPLPERKTKEQIAIENARKPDCRTAYQSLGLAAIVPLIANEFGEGNCRW